MELHQLDLLHFWYVLQCSVNLLVFLICICGPFVLIEMTASTPIAALNWQWSYTNGPVTVIEEAIFWVTVVLSIWGGFTFVKIGYYQPLIPLWIATGFSLLAFILSAKARSTPSLLIRLA